MFLDGGYLKITVENKKGIPEAGDSIKV